MNGRWDLLPMSCRAAFNRRRLVRRWVVAYVMTAVVLGTLTGVFEFGNVSKQKERDALSAQVEVRWMQNEEARALLETIRELEASIARFNRLAWPVRVSDAIGVMSPQVPESATLTSLTFVPRKERVGGGRKRGRDRGKSDGPEERRYLALELEGFALDDLDVATLVSALEGHPLFSEVSLDYSRPRSVDGLDARAFRLSCRIDLMRRYSFAEADVDVDGGVSP